MIRASIFPAAWKPTSTTILCRRRIDNEEMKTVAAARICVDADSCRNVIKDILYRAAERTGVNVTLVANQTLTTPRIPSLRSIQVASGFDVADNEIVKRVALGC